MKGEQHHIEQLEFEMDMPTGDRVRFQVQAQIEHKEPESTLIYDVLSKTLKKKLARTEFSRIESLIKKLDWHIDLIHRDRQIKKEIQELTDSGTKLYEAIEAVAGKHYLSIEHVYTIWYDKQYS